MIACRHIKVMHLGLGQPATCGVCGETFARRSKLIEHTNLKHRKDDKYVALNLLLLTHSLPNNCILTAQVSMQDLSETLRQ
jgi:hypothetical protein